jgi:hypothetical protein
MYDCFVTRYVNTVRNFYHIAQPPSWSTTYFRLSAMLIPYFASTLRIGSHSFIRNLRTRYTSWCCAAAPGKHHWFLPSGQSHPQLPENCSRELKFGDRLIKG